MELRRLESMINGWFVGNFEPSLYKTKEVEVAVKEYMAGDYEQPHLHKIATEITVIVSGEAEMNNIRYMQGDIIVLYPGEVTDFKAVMPTTSVVVKIPGANSDKYPV
ncbi:MAG: hypothetical protein N3I35_10070 [Clostridia bacterium]|nr:hypothetical protein [Clostridia bacterium]